MKFCTQDEYKIKGNAKLLPKSSDNKCQGELKNFR